MTTMTPEAAVRAVLEERISTGGLVILGETAGRLGATEGMQDDSLLDLPVADRGVLGVGLGLALGGKTVLVELSGTDRLVAGLEVLRNAATIALRGDFSVPLVVRVPWGADASAVDAPVSASVLGIDGLSVVCAHDADSAAGLLRTALSGHGPTVVLEPRTLQGQRGSVSGSATGLHARTLREGTHVTLAAWGTGVAAALEAATALAQDQIEAEVIDLVSLHPVDRATLGASVRKTGRLVVAHPNDPALADAVRATTLEDAFLYLESPLSTAADRPEALAQAARDAVLY